MNTSGNMSITLALLQIIPTRASQQVSSYRPQRYLPCFHRPDPPTFANGRDTIPHAAAPADLLVAPESVAAALQIDDPSLTKLPIHLAGTRVDRSP